jgi:hypothetical protein
MSIQIADLAPIKLQDLTATEAGKVLGGEHGGKYYEEKKEYEYEHGYKKEEEYEYGYKKEAKEYEYEYEQKGKFKKLGYYG